MTRDLIAIGADLVVEIVRLIMAAVHAEDPAALRRVADVLPDGHGLRARVALLAARAAAERELRG
jgi:hypothetical protein